MSGDSCYAWLPTIQPESRRKNLWTRTVIVMNILSNVMKTYLQLYSAEASPSLAPSQDKDGLSGYGDFHYKDKTVVTASYLGNGNIYAGKVLFLYWNGPWFLWWGSIFLWEPLSGLIRLTNWCHQFADDIFKCIFVIENDFIDPNFTEGCSQNVQLTICQHWFRLWLGVEQATSHYLN